ncbi:DUF1801 domain-containing protein [Flavobacterium chuncheonense]|uniref:DUF1801 domain-containing protein n=1 Tax=Flavobacterium chuncheonense TaxID=2026653 RepID=A0ABW5YKR9_9FLAO
MNPVNEYILKQPKHYQIMLLDVISIIEKELGESQLLLKWGIPYFYFKKKPFVYLAPNHKKEFLDIGFARGFQLKAHQDYLIGENRNTVKSLRYKSLKAIQPEVLIAVIKEAELLYK